jgi:hypothetical protein
LEIFNLLNSIPNVSRNAFQGDVKRELTVLKKLSFLLFFFVGIKIKNLLVMVSAFNIPRLFPPQVLLIFLERKLFFRSSAKKNRDNLFFWGQNGAGLSRTDFRWGRERSDGEEWRVALPAIHTSQMLSMFATSSAS